jgi:hypothetical protein
MQLTARKFIHQPRYDNQNGSLYGAFKPQYSYLTDKKKTQRLTFADLGKLTVDNRKNRSVTIWRPSNRKLFFRARRWQRKNLNDFAKVNAQCT